MDPTPVPSSAPMMTRESFTSTVAKINEAAPKYIQAGADSIFIFLLLSIGLSIAMTVFWAVIGYFTKD